MGHGSGAPSGAAVGFPHLLTCLSVCLSLICVCVLCVSVFHLVHFFVKTLGLPQFYG